MAYRGEYMNPLRFRLEKERERLQINWNIIEQDYVLSWVLYGIAKQQALCNNLVFKGGTALKKCYFGNYRFSEDCDFSLLNNIPATELDELVFASCKLASIALNENIGSSEIICTKYTEKQPHPEDQAAYTVFCKLPWHSRPFTRVMIEITRNEPLLKPPVLLEVIHNYGEGLIMHLPCYSLEEILAEKLRAILQYSIKLHERGWSRSRARDYYDIWSIIRKYQDSLKIAEVKPLLIQKSALKNITFSGIEDFFDLKVIEQVSKTWDQWLGRLVVDLPSAQVILKEVREDIKMLLEG
jgi:predicted nucleotidyltransferase component of viral defense system